MTNTGEIKYGALTIGAQAVALDGEPVDLTAPERRLLRALATQPHRVVPKAELIASVLGSRGTVRALDSHAVRLRHKLSRDPRKLIHNVWGVGYRLAREPAPEQTPADPTIETTIR